MKTFILIVSLLLMMAGCAEAQEKEALEMRQDKETITTLFEAAFNQRKLELLNQLVSPDYVGPNGEKGPDGFIGKLQRTEVRFSGHPLPDS